MEKVNVKLVEQFHVNKWRVKVFELNSGVGIIIEDIKGKRQYYIPPVVFDNIHVKLPKYVIEQLSWLVEQPDIVISEE